MLPAATFQSQPAPAPPPPPATATAAGTPATVRAPGGLVVQGTVNGTAQGADAATTIRPPTDFDMLTALRKRERDVRYSLDQATEERDDLAESLQPSEEGPAPSPEVTSGVSARIAIIDERILRLERERDAIDRALAVTDPGLIANESQEVAASTALRDGREEGLVIGGSAGIPIGVVCTLAVMAFVRRRAARRGERAAAREGRAPEQLVSAVEAMAIEVERIGESQRYLTQLLLDRSEAPHVTPGGATRDAAWAERRSGEPPR